MSNPSPLPGNKPLSPTATTALLRSTLRDRTAGVILGSALGDAIGLYTEFLSAALSSEAYPSGKFTLTGTPPTPFKLDSHRAPKEPGHWTDDTDHALLLLLAFLHTAKTGDAKENEVPLPTQQEFAARLRVWVQQGFPPLGTMPLGLGRLVGSVVSSKGFDSDPESVARGYWERTGKRVAPNGSLMRTHPLGVICLLRGETEAFEVAAGISRVTHVDPRCVVACVIGTGLVRAVVRGEVQGEGDVDALVERAVQWYRDGGRGNDEGELDREELQRHVNPEGGLDGLKIDDAPTIGYVYKTLGSGVVLLRMAIRRMALNGGLLDRSRVFEDLITDLIMRGGDADTNACFAGALLGGYLGYSALPDHWKHGLKHEEWLLSKSDALCQVLGLMDGAYSGQEDKDTELYGGRPVISQDEMEGRWMVLQQNTFKKMEDVAKAAASKASGSGWSLPWHSKDKAKR
jgi:ADP-ribosylglycohydrolase